MCAHGVYMLLPPGVEHFGEGINCFHLRNVKLFYELSTSVSDSKNVNKRKLINICSLICAGATVGCGVILSG